MKKKNYIYAIFYSTLIILLILILVLVPVFNNKNSLQDSNANTNLADTNAGSVDSDGSLFEDNDRAPGDNKDSEEYKPDVDLENPDDNKEVSDGKTEIPTNPSDVDGENSSDNKDDETKVPDTSDEDKENENKSNIRCEILISAEEIDGVYHVSSSSRSITFTCYFYNGDELISNQNLDVVSSNTSILTIKKIATPMITLKPSAKGEVDIIISLQEDIGISKILHFVVE